ncbi:MAG: DMT family transporter [Anaerolineae bacterium]|nr:DMT family transporter [Anaerolineae bacterium]
MTTQPRSSTWHVLVPFLSPVFLGIAPLFGKLAYQAGANPFTVAAIRTIIAAVILWVVYLIFWRRYIFIYPAGLLGCAVVGVVNGIGSLMYYNGLNLLDASLVQLVNGTYIVFVVLLARLDGQPITGRTVFRVGLALLALLLLAGLAPGGVNWLGVGLMLGNALMFAGTVLLSQRVLYEMPAPTVTLYVLTTMAIVVSIVWIGYGLATPTGGFSGDAAGAILALGISTALARLTMFLGVKVMGGLQTALLAITEIGVTLLLAYLFLGDRLSGVQWVGVAILAGSILLMRGDETPQSPVLKLPNMAGITLSQQMAFQQAFSNDGVKITPEEMEAIRRMMGSAADQPPPPIPTRSDELPTAPKEPGEAGAPAD